MKSTSIYEKVGEVLGDMSLLSHATHLSAMKRCFFVRRTWRILPSSVCSLERGYNWCSCILNQWGGGRPKQKRERERESGTTTVNPGISKSIKCRLEIKAISLLITAVKWKMVGSRKPYWLCKTEHDQLREGNIGCDGRRLSFGSH